MVFVCSPKFAGVVSTQFFTNTPVSDSIESSSILEQTFQNLRLDSDEEDERIKQQDLTATEIQSIQKQLNSMQS